MGWAGGRHMPTEYTSVLLGSGTQLSDLNILQPQEEGTPEGSLILLELDLAEPIDQSIVDSINAECAAVNVTTWPGYADVAYIDASGQVLSLMWLKGMAFLTIILGILGLTVLPALLGVFLWWLIPEEVKSMIDMMVMMLMMVLMMKIMAPMFSSGEKPKRVEEGA
jgi:hypothetical protein